MTLFVGDRLRQGREARGLTAIALAEVLGVSRQAVSQFEKNRSSPSDETLGRICAALNLKHQFFLRECGAVDASAIFYRSLSAATKVARRRAEQRLEWLKEIVSYLQQYVSFPKVNIPNLTDVTDPRDLSNDEIERIASETRRFWKIGNGPISNLVLLLENNGILVARHEIGADTLDAFSQWSESLDMPLIVLGSEKDSATRSRFDAAHELGHLILHRRVPAKLLNKKEIFKLMEQQAHRYSGAILLPAETFATDVIAPQLDSLKLLKSKWKVAISAMVMRAFHLGLISEDRKSRLMINLTQRGWRMREPLDDVLEPEQPRYLSRCFELMMVSGLIDYGSVPELFGFSDTEVESLCSLPRGLLSRMVNDIEPQIIKLAR